MKKRNTEAILTIAVLSVALSAVNFIGSAHDKDDKEHKIVGTVVNADTAAAADAKVEAVAIEVQNHTMQPGKEKQERKEEKHGKVEKAPQVGHGQTERYLVSDNEKGRELTKLVGKTIEATGTVQTDDQGNKTLAITKYTVLKDEPKIPEKKTTRKN